MKRFISMYFPAYPSVLVYMLQNVEYQPYAFIRWWRRVDSFNSVVYRRKLDKTKSARLLLWFARLSAILQLTIGLTLLIVGLQASYLPLLVMSLIVFLCYPYASAYLLLMPIYLGQILIVNPKNKRLIKQSAKIFDTHSGIKIAVAGSYGKTTMKELLLTVLSEEKNVAATPANKNVASSHAKFALNLTGKEDFIIIEYGEGAPGDVKKFTNTTKPNFGIITGLAPAHLDKYPTLKDAGEDIFYLAQYLDNKVCVNTESIFVKQFLEKSYLTYDSSSALGWKISNIKLSFEGLSFEMKNKKKHLKLTSKLLGRHQVGPLAVVAAIADRFGVSLTAIERGVAKTEAFAHRMQSRYVNGAWIIDDTYNGNIEGMRAGLDLLSSLPAKKRIYVTPGLVDQGIETQNVHLKLGGLIAKAKVDKVVLMNNSVTSYIKKGLKKNDYKGELMIESDPLRFYNNLEHFIANGDVVMLQNDWTDNYN